MGLFDFLDKNKQQEPIKNTERFHNLLTKMQDNRWKITLIVLSTFFFIVLGIVMAVTFKATIDSSWKELLLLLLGAFVGSFSKVIDFWFSNEDRDKLLVQKMDEEDDDEEKEKEIPEEINPE